MSELVAASPAPSPLENTQVRTAAESFEGIENNLL